jgi:diamine N-acetyltransferase
VSHEVRRSPGPRFVMGERVILRRIERSDVPHVRRWYDDPETRALTGATEPLTEAQADKWFEDAASDPARAWYAIETSEGRVIGECGLLRMFPEWRTTDMSIIIGEKDARGHGYGGEAGRLLLDLAFSYMGFHRVAIGVVGFNEGALRFWERLGFRKEGVQRDGYLHGGAFSDFVMMSILEDEWRAGTAGAESASRS